MVITNFDIFSNLMASSMTTSPPMFAILAFKPWYICTTSLIMMSSFVLKLSWKNVVNLFLSYNKRLNLSSSCDVISDIINMIYTFSRMICKRSFHIWCQIEAILKISKFWKLTQFWEIQYAILIAKSIPYIWFRTDALAQTLNELWHLKCDLPFHRVT